MKTDAQLKHDVENELHWEPSVNEAHIGVSVKEGVVTITGHVPTYAERHGAEMAAKRVFGVKAVANELDVKLAGSHARTDEDIARACVGAIEAHSTVPPDRVKVVVSGGCVTLEGDVEWQYQKEAAENAVRYLRGVLGVTNSIRVKPRLSASDIQSKIEAAFKRSARIDAQHVRVATQDGKVTLSGLVRSWAEAQEAAQVAWSAPGVTQVENRIAIGM
jgi:osmotically-inducible protein OsmY